MKEYVTYGSVALLLLGGCASNPTAVPLTPKPVVTPSPQEDSLAIRTPIAESPVLEKSALPEVEAQRGSEAGDAAAAEINKYMAGIRHKISSYWKRPQASREGLTCTARVQLAPSGKVMAAKLLRSSGDAAFDGSVLSAVRKASPLPLPADPELYEQFREIEFVFRPDA